MLLAAGLWATSGCDNGTTSTGLEVEDSADAANLVGGVDPAVVLQQVIKLIRTAPENPGGANFTNAAQSLNDFFLGTRAEEFLLPESTMDFLGKHSLPPNAIESIRRPQFDGLFDGRHLDDSLLLSDVSEAILSRGPPLQSDLAKAERLFDWVVQNIQLVPVGALAPPGAVMADGQPMQPQARPYDVLVRGLASEDGAQWADRSWLFLALCRQAEIDAAYLALVDPTIQVSPSPDVTQTEPALTPFACAVLSEGKVYLFDAKHGFRIPGKTGAGVATFQEADTDPAVLDRLDLPNLAYALNQSDLARCKVRVLLNATICSVAPRMRLLQERLTGDDRMILYRDPVDQAAKFSQAFGGRLESVILWNLPLSVEYLLFHEGAFNEATGFAMQPFTPRWPLLRARLLQLRGNLDDAIKAYVAFRFSHDTLDNRGEPIPRDVQGILDIYATQFLALAQLDKERPDEAAFLFGETLRLLPEPSPGLPFFMTFRWGANRNLGMLLAKKGQNALAVRYLTADNPTYDAVRNRLVAQELINQEPFAPGEEVPRPARAPKPPPTVRMDAAAKPK